MMKKTAKLSVFIFAAIILSAGFACLPVGTASAQYYTGLCTPNASTRCIGNSVYSFDSCGNQQNFLQSCPQGCLNGVCSNNYNYNNNYQNYNNYNNCTFHAYKLCLGNNIYWYDSCGNQEDIFQSCVGANMTCRYGQCTYQPVLPPVVPQNPYISHAKIACYFNNIYWYDSLGKEVGLYKSCADANSCTLDACASGKCSNTIMCDGSTCQVGSADYNNYCGNSNQNQNNIPVNPINNNNTSNNLSISFFVKPTQSSTQWQKTVDVGSNGQVYFMITVVNNYGTQADNIMVSANIPNEITSLGNLQVDGAAFSGDIVAGINIGSLSPGTSKSITFEGKTQSIASPAMSPAVATINVGGAPKTDSVSISFTPGQAVSAAVSSSSATSGFWAFLKKWYLWILVGLVLIFLFVVVFRRLSSND